MHDLNVKFIPMADAPLSELSPRSRPFLTAEQREALDAALAEKQGRVRQV